MRRAQLAVLSMIAALALTGGAEQAVSAPGCAGTAVHYRAPSGLSDPGLRLLPWVAAAPASAGLLGHLFYYGSVPWGRAKAPDLRIYTGGSDNRGSNMKILWRSRRPGASARLSIVDIPAPGCWLLTLQTGKLAGTVTVAAVAPPG